MKFIKLFIVLILISISPLRSQILWQPQGSFEMQNIRTLGAMGIPISDTINWIGFTNRDSTGCLRIRPADGLIYVKHQGYWAALAPVSLVATKLNLSDTASMLNPYLRKGDTAYMLSPYLRKGDTSSISARINLKLNISDTSSMLAAYLRKGDTSNMLLPYLHKSDTSLMLTPYLRKGDTSNMLLPYLRKSDTSTLSTRINSKLNLSDTLAMLAPYLRKGDTANMLLPYLRKSDTVTLSNRINTKVNINDTATMLTPYLRKGDTSNMLNPYLRKGDTSNMLLPYLRKNDTTAMLNGYFRIASNGLSASGHTVSLGGTLTGATTISLGTQSFNIFSSSSINGGIKFATNSASFGLYNVGIQASGFNLTTDGVTFVANQFFDSGTKGIVYAADYSAVGKLDNRWIPDYGAVINKVHDTAVLKVNYTDTSAMLNPYLRKGDTANMLIPYARAANSITLTNGGGLTITGGTQTIGASRTWTITANGATLFTQTADATITNTTTETTGIASGTGSVTLSANTLTVGKNLHIKIGGVYSTPVGLGTLTIKAKIGGVIVAQTPAITLAANQTNSTYTAEINVTTRTTGTTGTVMSNGLFTWAAGASDMSNSGNTTTINTTISNAIDITFQWSSALSTEIIKSTNVIITTQN